jgi:hypothetical protein
VDSRSGSHSRPRTASETSRLAPPSRVGLSQGTQVLAVSKERSNELHRRARRAQTLTLLVTVVVGGIALWSRRPVVETPERTASPTPIVQSEPSPAESPVERLQPPSPSPEPVARPVPSPPTARPLALPPLPSMPNPLPPPTVPPPPPAPTFTPPPPPVPPVNFGVSAIAGNDSHRTAVIEFEGQNYIVEAGTKIPDSYRPVFEVKAVLDNAVEVFDRRTSRIIVKRLGY